MDQVLITAVTATPPESGTITDSYRGSLHNGMFWLHNLALTRKEQGMLTGLKVEFAVLGEADKNA